MPGGLAGLSGRTAYHCCGSGRRCVGDFECVIDFTHSHPRLVNVALCRAAGKAMVIGTTGFSDARKQSCCWRAGQERFRCSSRRISVWASTVPQVAEYGQRGHGDEADIEIIEAHHRHKWMRPRVLALRMGEELPPRAVGRDLGKVAVYGREAQTGARERETIGSLRSGQGDCSG